MADRSVVRIDRKSSIESEPMTLKLSQIQFAREAALYVINSMTIEDAMRIFTEGLKPVEVDNEERNTTMMDWSEDFYDREEEGELRQLERLRDVLSAPF